MNNSHLFFSFFLILISFNSFSAESNHSSIESADLLYQNGDCEKAIPAYQSIQGSSLNQSQKDAILFKTSYCHFSLAHYQESENGFKSYLSLHPNEDEAMLKYAQSALFQAKHKLAKEVAQKVSAAAFKADAAIVIARSQIELEEFKNAIITLKPYSENAEALYWMALAHYYSDSDSEAEQKFNLAIQKSAANSWVQTDSKAWLNRMKEDKRKFHLRLTLGVFKDSNIDQSGGTGTINPVGPGQGGPGQNGPGQNGPGNSKPVYTGTNYTSDTGKYAAVDFIHNTYTSRKLNLTTTAAFSSPFYSKHPTYNQESASLDFNLKATASPTFNYGVSLKYQDTFYNKIYSQDYIYVTPTASWSFASDYWLRFSIPVTRYLNNKQIKLIGGNADLYYDPTDWVSISVGASSTKSTAPAVNIQDYGSGPVLVSGTMFSQYTTTGAYLGLTFYLFDSYTFGVTGSSYTTSYEQDKMPGPDKHQARKDKLKAYQFTFTKSFIQNVLSANLSYSHSDNKSEGFPGLASGGSITNNTYTRSYGLLTLEYYY